MTMARYASEVVKQAQSWVGKKELDGSFKEIIDIYNGHKPLARGYKVKYTDAWCMPFAAAVAIKLKYTDIIPTECSCGKMIELCKEAGIWIENENRTPNPGELIFYDWQDSGKGDNKGWPDHIGIVEVVKNGKITVIEGNYNSAVGRRVIVVNAKNIRGYAAPKYDKEPVKAPTEPAKPTTSKYKTGLYEVTCGSLNRRTKPDPDSKLAGSAIHKGDQLNVTKIENGAWGYAENLKAWVNVSDIYCKYLGSATSTKKVPKAGDLVHVKGTLYSGKNGGGNSIDVDRNLYIVRIYASGKTPIAFSKTKGGTTYGFGCEADIK